MIVFEILFFFFCRYMFLIPPSPFFLCLAFIFHCICSLGYGGELLVVWISGLCSAKVYTLCFTPCMSEQTPWFRVQSLVSLEPLTVKE